MKLSSIINSSYKKVLVLFPLVILIISVFFIVLSIKKMDSTIVALINGEPVSVDEFNHFYPNHRIQVYSYFSKKYNENSNPDFWNTTINGENPAEMVRKITMEELVRIKAIQILCKENGLIEDISYAAFLNNLVMENEKRDE